jgi:galactarate dehydratase
MTEAPIIIRTTKEDNVGIVANAGGLKKGTVLTDGIILSDDIPTGHKVALTGIPEGGKIIRYGQVIAYAVRQIFPGEWVHESKITLPDPPDLDSIPLPAKSHSHSHTHTSSHTHSDSHPLPGYTFHGYPNADGTVGTKNILGITISVQCVAGITNYIVRKIKEELLPKYPNVDDAVALNHSYGCGVDINAREAEIPVRTIRNIAANPNFGGQILITSLGCEKLLPGRLLFNDHVSQGDPGINGRDIIILQDESYHGFDAMVAAIMKRAEEQLKILDARKRVLCPASDLIVGMQCGGSDAFSGITANPVAGFASDLIVRAGGSVMFSEVTEVRDAIHLLVPRTIDHEVGQALINEMKWYDDYLAKWGSDRSANPAPGNKRGGLSNIVEKALGSAAKSGTSHIVDVLAPGERIRLKGLTFAATPAGDFVCGTLQVAAGMNVHVFTTGMGTPYGLAMVPVIKVGTNSKLSKRWFDLIDLDAGQVALGLKTIEEMGWELFGMILDVASGKKITAADRLGLHNDLVLFNPGPVT